MDTLKKSINGLVNSLCNVDLIKECLEKDHFFGETCGLTARELLIIFFEIEKKFGIHFTEKDILDEQFYYLDGLTSIIQRKLNSEARVCLP